MGSKFFVHLRRQWMEALALFLVLTGGVAYAANTVFSSDIVNGEVKSVDIGTGQVQTADVKNESLTGHDIQDNTIGGADVNEALLDSGVVKGRGELLSNRIVRVPGDPAETLLEIPGLGELRAFCRPGFFGEISWRNATGAPVDLWVETADGVFDTVAPSDPGHFYDVAKSVSVSHASLGLGRGNDPGPRRVATVDVFTYQGSPDAPCGFQAQGTLWTSE